jgi:hypothetical protein
MELSIRMIGVASTFFWIILIAFFASAAYSVKDLHLSLEQPMLSLDSTSNVIVSIPLNIENGGYYNLGEFNITTKVYNANGSTLAKGSTFIATIKRGEKLAAFHNLTVRFEELLQKGAYYLFNDSSLSIVAAISMKLAEVIPVQALSNYSVPWGAPFYGFKLGEPTFEAFNTTHVKVVLPINFENHAFFDLQGEIQLRMYNSEGLLVGEGKSAIEVPQRIPYSGSLTFYAKAAEITENGRFEVYFSTPLLTYGPLVIPYG